MFSAPKAKRQVHERKTPQTTSSAKTILHYSFARRGDWVHARGKEIGQQSNRLHAFLQLSFPLLEKVFSKSSILFQNIVQLFPHPAGFKGMSKDQLREQIKRATRKNLSVKQAEENCMVLGV